MKSCQAHAWPRFKDANDQIPLVQSNRVKSTLICCQVSQHTLSGLSGSQGGATQYQAGLPLLNITLLSPWLVQL